MNNSPFDLFRRNLKPMMVFLTGLALFAFVVLPVMDTYMRRNAGLAGDRVVARFDGQELTQNRVEYFTQNHQATLQFLSALAQETMNRQGSPRTAGFELDPRTGQIQSVGINPQPSAEGTIRTFLFSAQAQKAGFELSDNDLAIWLEQFTDGLISNGEIDGMLMKMTQNRMGRPHLYEQLRHHMLSQVYMIRGYAGLGAMTPEEQWTNFLKLNQDAVASTYEILVSKYLDQTNPTPSEDQIREMYEKGKDRDPSDQSAEPAFHRRYSARFEYLVGSYDKFLREEVEKLTEDDLRAEYQRRLEGGDFQLPDAPPAETPATDAAAPSDATSDADSETSTDSADEGDEGADAGDASDEASTETENTEASAEEDASADAETTDTAADDSDAEAADSEAQPESGDGDADSETEAAEGDQSSVTAPSAVRLVSMQEESSQESGDAAQDENASEEETSDAAGDENAAGQAPGEASSQGAQESAEEGASSEEATDSAEDESPKVESFEDVRKSLEASLAGPAARKRWTDVMASVESVMKNYFSEQAIHESQVIIGEESEPPAKPDMEALAAKYGLEHEVIGPYDAFSIREEPIANTFEISAQFGGRAPTFTQIMYTLGQDGSPSKPLWSPLRTEDAAAGKQYVSWKIEQTAAFTPSLDDEGVRDEVVLAIREEEARKLAMAAADAIAAKAAAEPDKPLKDFVPEDDREQFVKEGLGPFKWMNMFGFSGATIGNVPELNSVGDDFMKAVFTTSLNGVSSATNENGEVVYVVKPTAFSPASDELREQFKQPTNRMMTRMLGNDSNAVLADFFKSVDEAADFKDYLNDPEE